MSSPSDMSQTEDNNLVTSEVTETAGQEQPVSEYEAAKEPAAVEAQQENIQQASMSPEHTLLLQVLRRAKRQQDLIIQVQKSLKTLSSIEKQVTRTTDQVKQLQSTAKETQRQIAQTQRQIAAVEKRVQKVAASKKSASPKRSAAGKKNKARKKAGSKRK